MTLQLYINVYLFDPYSRKEEVIIITITMTNFKGIVKIFFISKIKHRSGSIFNFFIYLS